MHVIKKPYTNLGAQNVKKMLFATWADLPEAAFSLPYPVAMVWNIQKKDAAV